MTLITFKDGKPVMRDGHIGTGQPCCCGQPCSCESSEPKVWVTFNGEEKGLAVCDYADWSLCSSPPTAVAVAYATTFYFPDQDAPTSLRVSLGSGYSSIGNCLTHPSIGAGTDWIYEYALDANNCPTGDPTLISETTYDDTHLCGEPGECCDETCFGIMPSPSLSLLP